MNKKHEKSACCRANVVGYGGRRRQCVLCRRTWSRWKKRRGRKKKRIDVYLVKKFLHRDVSSLAYLARKKDVSEAFVQSQLRKSRDSFTKKTSWPDVPRGNLILIADAVIEMIERKWRTVYLMLVRPVLSDTAVILPPLILDGTETFDRWRKAIDTIPNRVLCSIRAIVCDGHKGLVGEGSWRHWIIQRCHFHLLARIQSRRSRFFTTRHKQEAEMIFNHVHVVLGHHDARRIVRSLDALEEIGWLSTSPEIRKVLSGFVSNYGDYRSYLTYPKLNLPITNNTAESLASSIADLKHRMRGFKTLHSFTSWIIALLKFKRAVKCRGYQQN